MYCDRFSYILFCFQFACVEGPGAYLLVFFIHIFLFTICMGLYPGKGHYKTAGEKPEKLSLSPPGYSQVFGAALMW